MEQLALDVTLPEPEGEAEPRTYWENRGPHDWQPVTVRVRYAVPASPMEPVFPEVRTGAVSPRNVLVEREDGSRDVRPVRVLRRNEPR